MIRTVISDRPASLESVDDDVQIRLATQPDELRGAFELVYHSYMRAGLTGTNPEEIRVTPYQLQESAEVIVAVKQEENQEKVIGTVSLIRDGEEWGLPLEDAYAREVAQLRGDKIKLAEVSCLADRRSEVERSLPLLLNMMTVLAQTARHHGVEQLLIAVHPRHARFYQRVMGFSQIGETREYRAVCGRPAIALAIDLVHSAERTPRAHALFFGNSLPTVQLTRKSPRCSTFLRDMEAFVTPRRRTRYGGHHQQPTDVPLESAGSGQESSWRTIRQLILGRDQETSGVRATVPVAC